MKSFWGILVGILLCTSLFAQKNVDLITFTARNGFSQNYDNEAYGSAKEKGLLVSALIPPIRISEKTRWYNSVNYYFWSVESDDVLPSEMLSSIKIHGMILRSGLLHKLNDKSEVVLIFMPRLMSDLHHINGDHFQFGGIAMFKKSYNPELNISYGAMFNRELFGPYLVPMIDLYWQISDKWKISGLLPVSSKITYTINQRLETGITHFGLLSTYKIGDPAYDEYYVERECIDVSLYGRYKIIGNIYLEARIGQTLGRSYAQYATDQKVDFSIPLIRFGDQRLQSNIDFKDGAIAELRLIFNVPVPDR